VAGSVDDLELRDVFGERSGDLFGGADRRDRVKITDGNKRRRRDRPELIEDVGSADEVHAAATKSVFLTFG
jgi:hypothetical protein